eukprot:6208351-Pleurochrysis_carterae.AAC.1
MGRRGGRIQRAGTEEFMPRLHAGGCPLAAGCHHYLNSALTGCERPLDRRGEGLSHAAQAPGMRVARVPLCCRCAHGRADSRTQVRACGRRCAARLLPLPP